MKITIYPTSALAGAALLGLTLLASSAVQSPGDASLIGSFRRFTGPIEVVGIPDPHDMVVIRELDGPYTVPAGKLLVLTGIGFTGGSTGAVSLALDGIPELRMESTNGSSVITLIPVPAGFTAQAGSTISLSTANTVGRAYGYLVDA